MAEVERLKYFINNQWKESMAEKYMPVFDPNTGEKIAETPCCTVDEVNEAVEAARAAFPEWSRMPVQRRLQVLFNWKRLLDLNLDELALSVCHEQGKTISEAKGEISKLVETVEIACAVPFLMQGDTQMQVSHGFDCLSIREPLGVFGGISPCNFPAMIPYGWMLPMCIATGNTFVLKQASLVPVTGIKILNLLVEAGLPPGVVSRVTCTRNEAELILRHPDIRGVSYVGSTSVGKHIYATAAASGKRVQALCEAKNHALVLRDAKLREAAEVAITSANGCAGQRCMALPVVMVEEAVADEFVSYLVEYAKKLRIGCSYLAETTLGPVGSEEHKKYVLDWISKGEAEGAEVVLDGRNVTVPGYENGYFIGPTILDRVKPGMSVGDFEIFGPVLCVKRVSCFEEGLAIANNNHLANGSIIFTQNGYYAREFFMNTHGGMVGINVGIPVPSSYFPFSGHKNSFFSDLHVLGKDGAAFYTESKTLTMRWFTEGDGKNPSISEFEKALSRPTGCSGA